MDERAQVKLLNPAHPLLNWRTPSPMRISAAGLKSAATLFWIAGMLVTRR